MGRQKKYQDLDIYAPQKAYFKTEKGQQAVKRYESSEARRIARRDWQRKARGMIVDKRQWFIENYGQIETALSVLNPQEKLVIEFSYGLINDETLTQRAIAKKIGTSQPYISILKKSAIAKLNSLKKNN